jgi:hypothetical protein
MVVLRGATMWAGMMAASHGAPVANRARNRGGATRSIGGEKGGGRRQLGGKKENINKWAMLILILRYLFCAIIFSYRKTFSVNLILVLGYHLLEML